jgi:hypothetical protein
MRLVLAYLFQIRPASCFPEGLAAASVLPLFHVRLCMYILRDAVTERSARVEIKTSAVRAEMSSATATVDTVLLCAGVYIYLGEKSIYDALVCNSIEQQTILLIDIRALHCE